jgi:hypothetical protein
VPCETPDPVRHRLQPYKSLSCAGNTSGRSRIASAGAGRLARGVIIG